MRGRSSLFPRALTPLFLLAGPIPLGSHPASAAVLPLCAATSPRNGRLRQALLYACVTVLGEAERVTHVPNWRNAMFLLGISPAPST